MANNAKNIGEFQLVDHGIENIQYFSGCGVSFTNFEEVTTGIGNNLEQAIDDCLEQMAMNGWNVDNMVSRIKEQIDLGLMVWEEIPETPSVVHERDAYGDDTYYHVSIQWNAREAVVTLEDLVKQAVTKWQNVTDFAKGYVDEDEDEANNWTITYRVDSEDGDRIKALEKAMKPYTYDPDADDPDVMFVNVWYKDRAPSLRVVIRVYARGKVTDAFLDYCKLVNTLS